ncbi:24653_t:CDS:2, partial [Dentiscutata erythropus]
MSVSYAFFSFDILLSMIWKNKLQDAPYGFCVFQGLVLQYMCYVSVACALCFSIHIYHLLVLRKKTTTQKIYYGFIIIYPTVMTCIIMALSLHFKAIKPRRMNCDIVSPSWIRLLANSGSNLLLSIPGVYFSGRSAYAVCKHLEYFRDSTELSSGSRGQMASNNSNSAQIKSPSSIRCLDPSYQQNDCGVENFLDSYQQSGPNLSPSHQRTNSDLILNLEPSHRRTNKLSQLSTFPGNRSTSTFTKNTRNYDMTKAAAIRMVLFASLFALVNLLASVGAVIGIINGHPIPTGVTVTDWVGGFQGILIIIVFGLPNNWKRFLRKSLVK